MDSACITRDVLPVTERLQVGDIFFSQENALRLARENSIAGKVLTREELNKILLDPRVEKVVFTREGDISAVALITANLEALGDYGPTRLYVADRDGDSVRSSFWESSKDGLPGHYALIQEYDVDNTGCLPAALPAPSLLAKGLYRRHGRGRVFLPETIRVTSLSSSQVDEIQRIIEANGLHYLIDVIAKVGVSEELLGELVHAYMTTHNLDRMVLVTTDVDSSPLLTDLRNISEFMDGELTVQDYWIVGGIGDFVHKYGESIARGVESAKFMTKNASYVVAELVKQENLSIVERRTLENAMMSIEEENFAKGHTSSYHNLPYNKRSLQDQRWGREEIQRIVSQTSSDEVMIFLVKDEKGNVVGEYVQITPQGLRNKELRTYLYSGNPDAVPDSDISQMVYVANLALNADARQMTADTLGQMLAFAISRCDAPIDFLFADTGEKIGNSRLRELMVMKYRTKLIRNEQARYVAALISGEE